MLLLVFAVVILPFAQCSIALLSSPPFSPTSAITTDPASTFLAYDLFERRHADTLPPFLNVQVLKVTVKPDCTLDRQMLRPPLQFPARLLLVSHVETDRLGCTNIGNVRYPIAWHNGA
jgi:hypothetical protein